MTDQFTRQAQEIFAAAKEVRNPPKRPGDSRELGGQTHEAYSTMNSAAKDGVKVLEDVMVAAHAGARRSAENPPQHGNQRGGRFDAARRSSALELFLRLLACRRASCKVSLPLPALQTKELSSFRQRSPRQTFER